LVILNEHHDNYAIKIKETFLYGLYSILLFIITLLPLIISIFFPIFLLSLLDSAVGFLLVPIGLIWLFIAFPFFALNLPMVAIGKKISFFKMFAMSKGFRLTLFFQQLLLFFFTWLIGFLTAFFPVATFSFLINLFFSVYLFAIFLSCLSKTYILWEENNKIDN